MRKNKAFSLIEIMVVVVIVGALGSLAIVNYRKTMAVNYLRHLVNNMQMIRSGLEMYYAKYGQYPEPGTAGNTWDLNGLKTALKSTVNIQIGIEPVGSEAYQYSWIAADEYDLAIYPDLQRLNTSTTVELDYEQISGGATGTICCVPDDRCHSVVPNCGT